MNRFAIFTCLAISALGTAFANDREIADSIDNSFDLNELVVTGTRTAKALKDTPVLTRLISQSDLRKADATNLIDLLQQEMPGIEFSYAMNQQVNMNMAGFSGMGVLVLVDGEKLAGETMDNVDFSRIPMNNIERVEIIRGSASALYGSNATGGVINIVTKKPAHDWLVNLNARGGSHDEWRANATLGIRKSKISNTLDISFYRIGSYDVCLDTSDDCDFRKVYGNKVWNFNDKLEFNPLDGLRFSAKASYYFKERLYNIDIPERYRAFTGSAKCTWDISDKDLLEISYLFDQYDKSDYITALNKDIRDYSNVQHSVKCLYNRNLRERDVLTVGGDFLRDWLSSYQFEANETHFQYTADIFAQYDANITDCLELVGALRWDWFSDNGISYITPKVSIRYKLGKVVLRCGYAGGFRAPTLKEKYTNFNMADIFDIIGNKDLKSEKSHNFSISGEYVWRNLYFMASGHYNILNNKICTSGILHESDGTPYIEYMNVKRLQVFGTEVSVKAKWQFGLSTSVGYNFTHEEFPEGTAMPYCPARPHSVVARISWDKSWKKGFDFSASLSGRFLSSVSYTSMRMYEPFENYEVTDPAYTLWKLQLSQSIFNGVQFTFTIDNLFNYQPKIYSFNAPVTTGTTFQIGLNLEIDKLWKR